MNNEEKEVIIMVGYPGSGKTTYCLKNFDYTKYFIIHGDIYKTSKRMIKKAKEITKTKKSIVFDATNGNVNKRKEYIDFANIFGYKISCIYITTSFDESLIRNKTRDKDKQVPIIAYYLYRKGFEEPKEEEGYYKIIKI